MSYCIVVDLDDCDQWQPVHGCRRIPDFRRPTVLHPSREIAQAEARRLASQRPGHRYVVFDAVAVGHTVKVPTHITLGGQVIAERDMPTLSLIGIDEPDDIPF